MSPSSVAKCSFGLIRIQGSVPRTRDGRALGPDLGLYGLQRTSDTKNIETKKKAFEVI